MKRVVGLMLKFLAVSVIVTVNNYADTIPKPATPFQNNAATALDREVTTKTIVVESSTGKAGVRIREHYGMGRQMVYDGIILCDYDASTIYIGRALHPVIPISRNNWTIDSSWVIYDSPVTDPSKVNK